MEPLAHKFEEPICAIATPPGKGGVALIRISGKNILDIVKDAWKGKPIEKAPARSLLYGKYISKEGDLLDDLLLSFFEGPNSFTGEDTIELSLHGSAWIQKEVISDLLKRGIRLAEPGEFTKRAFINGKMDLAQAESVADLIASESKASHHLAMSQMKGDFSRELSNVREKLVELASLMELELDFSEEDVEFANRNTLVGLCGDLKHKIDNLASSFSVGEAIKNGVPVAIAGIPNAGKSSLLNLLMGEEKAIVTDIPGTTRDIIEDKVEIDGILFRFIDTAGLHVTEDPIEKIGIAKAEKAIGKAFIVIWIIDPSSPLDVQQELLNTYLNTNPSAHLILLRNKCDLTKEGKSDQLMEIERANSKAKNPYESHPDMNAFTGTSVTQESENQTVGKIEFSNTRSNPQISHETNENSLSVLLNQEFGIIDFSTVTREGLPELKQRLSSIVLKDYDQESVIVTNMRHYEALLHVSEALSRVLEGLSSGLSADLVSQDLREAIHYLGTITGEVSTNEILHTIFSRFCIGK